MPSYDKLHIYIYIGIRVNVTYDLLHNIFVRFKNTFTSFGGLKPTAERNAPCFFWGRDSRSLWREFLQRVGLGNEHLYGKLNIRMFIKMPVISSNLRHFSSFFLILEKFQHPLDDNWPWVIWHMFSYPSAPCCIIATKHACRPHRV